MNETQKTNIVYELLNIFVSQVISLLMSSSLLAHQLTESLQH